MDEPQRTPTEETVERPAPNPEERAFTGHPDHPPATPDQPVDGNEDLIRREEDEVEPEEGADR
jgi:hypothetical protein